MKDGKITGRRGTGGAYSGEKDMGDLSNWRILSSDANDILAGNYRVLSERSGTLYHTYPPVRGAVNKKTMYAIGPGLVFRSQPDYSMIGQSQDWAVGWGKEFQKIVDYYFREIGFYGKQSALYRTSLFGGDSLLFFDRKDGKLNDLIEVSGDQIDDCYHPEGYTLGIKHDKYFRREGIHKVDGTDVSFQDAEGYQNIIQYYKKELARQLRGYPLAYSVINLARNDDTHTDATTHRAVMEAIIMAVFKGNGTNINSQIDNLAKKNAALQAGKTTTPKTNVFNRVASALKLGSGNILTMNNTEDMEFLDMKTPSNNFEPYKDYMVKYVGMATDVPPEVIASMYSTSFTAHKGAFNDFIASFMMDRKNFERIVMNTVIREIAKDAIQQGFISAPGFFEGGRFTQAAYLKGMYLGPVPGHINPLVEVKADELSVKNQFKLRSDVASMNGHEFDTFVGEWAKEQDNFVKSPQSYADVTERETAGSEVDNNSNI